MEIKQTVAVKCPYCDENILLDKDVQSHLQIEPGRPFVLTCDADAGGCDKQFVVQVDFRPVVAVERIGPQYVVTEAGHAEPACGDCGRALSEVRPGEWQCDNPECLSQMRLGALKAGI
jgi:hypothetical protein